MPEYQVGDVVNGHRFNGQEWVPIAGPLTPTPPPPGPVAPPASPVAGVAGTGVYAGLTWDGKTWIGTASQPARRNGKGTASLVLGIISVLLCGGGLLLPILAVVFGRQGMRAADVGLADNRGVAKAGFILGIIALSLSAVFGVLYAIAYISDPAAFQ